MKPFFPFRPGLIMLVALALVPAKPVLAQNPVQKVYKDNQLDPNINAYWEHLPDDYQTATTTQYPLIIWIHGWGESGIGHSDDVLRRVLSSSLPRMIEARRFPGSFVSNGKSYKFIVLSPQIKDGIHIDSRSSKIAPSVIDAMIELAAKNYRVDIGRIYLCGMSMGGGAILDYLGSSTGAARKIAAAAIACPAADLSRAEADVLGSVGVPLVVAHNQADLLVYHSRSVASISNLELELDHPATRPIMMTYTVASPDDYKHDAWTRSFEHLVKGPDSDPSLPNKLGSNVYEWLLKSATVADAMPVTWNNFGLRKSSAGVLLEWSVSNQVNVANYNIHRSTDGVNWVRAGSRDARSGNGRELYYQFTDSIHTSAAMHYRIQSVDHDGRQGYTVVRTFRPENASAPLFAVFPNPFAGRITVHFEKQGQRSLVASLYNSVGMEIDRKLIKTSGAAGRFDLNNTSGLANGLYYLNISTTEGKLLFNSSLVKKD